jgi:hypothetical protein
MASLRLSLVRPPVRLPSSRGVAPSTMLASLATSLSAWGVVEDW